MGLSVAVGTGVKVGYGVYVGLGVAVGDSASVPQANNNRVRRTNGISNLGENIKGASLLDWIRLLAKANHSRCCRQGGTGHPCPAQAVRNGGQQRATRLALAIATVQQRVL